MEQTKISNYSEVKEKLLPVFPDAERMDMASLLNKEIVIKDFKAMPSSLAQGKEFVVILAEFNDKLISFPSGEVVLHQLQDVKDKLPIRTTITRKKGKRYYTLN